MNEKLYNMNVLNMFDFETYEMMRCYANKKFNLKLINPFLP